MTPSNFILVYTSKAAETVTETLLGDIFTTSRKQNTVFEITGFLVERNGYFLQLIEGREADIRALYKNIRNDKRHTQVTLQGESFSEKRVMPNWSMARVRLNESDAAVNDLLTIFELGRAGKPFENTETLLFILKRFAVNTEQFE